jgi:hypothetical protein
MNEIEKSHVEENPVENPVEACDGSCCDGCSGACEVFQSDPSERVTDVNFYNSLDVKMYEEADVFSMMCARRACYIAASDVSVQYLYNGDYTVALVSAAGVGQVVGVSKRRAGDDIIQQKGERIALSRAADQLQTLVGIPF